MNIQFEYLNENDLRECFDLCMRCFDEDSQFTDVEETYQICKNDPHYHFIVGKIQGHIVAYATMTIFYSLFDGKMPNATIWYVCVDSNYRRTGIGKLLFDEIERIDCNNNCQIIYLTCLKDNVSAQKFYNSIGYSGDKEKAFVKYFY